MQKLEETALQLQAVKAELHHLPRGAAPTAPLKGSPASAHQPDYALHDEPDAEHRERNDSSLVSVTADPRVGSLDCAQGPSRGDHRQVNYAEESLADQRPDVEPGTASTGSLVAAANASDAGFKSDATPIGGMTR